MHFWHLVGFIWNRNLSIKKSFKQLEWNICFLHEKFLIFSLALKIYEHKLHLLLLLNFKTIDNSEYKCSSRLLKKLLNLILLLLLLHLLLLWLLLNLLLVLLLFRLPKLKTLKLVSNWNVGILWIVFGLSFFINKFPFPWSI